MTAAVVFGCQSVLGIKDEVTFGADAGVISKPDAPAIVAFCSRPENVPSLTNTVQFCEDFDRGFSDFGAFENVGDAGLAVDQGKEGKGLLITSQNQPTLTALFKRSVLTRTDRTLVEAEFDIFLERFELSDPITFLIFRADGKLGASPVTASVSISQSDVAGTQLGFTIPPAPASALSLAPTSLLRRMQWSRFRLTFDLKSGKTRAAVLFNDGFVLPPLATPTDAQKLKPTESNDSSVELGPVDAGPDASDAAAPVLTVTNVQALVGAQTGKVVDLAVRLDNIVLRALQ
jgi:hypothetical protein